MQKYARSLPLLICGALMLLIVACTSTAELANENTASDTNPTDSPPSATHSPTATIVDPTATVVQLDTCTDCHMDKDRLVNTADEEQEIISENEGEG